MDCQKNIKKSEIKTAVVLKKKLTVGKTKTKSCEDKISSNIQDEGIPKEGSLCIFLSVILIDSVFKIGKKHSEVFLGECKYMVKKR